MEVDKILKECDTFTKVRILKNLFVISFAFLLISTSEDGLTVLQSTLNRDQGIGVLSTAVMLATGGLTAILLNKYTLVKFGSKNVLAFSILAHFPSTVANVYPRWLTMLPSYILLGIASGLLWVAGGVYLTNLSKIYANKSLEIMKPTKLKTDLKEDESETEKNIVLFESDKETNIKNCNYYDSFFTQFDENINSDLTTERYISHRHKVERTNFTLDSSVSAYHNISKKFIKNTGLCIKNEPSVTENVKVQCVEEIEKVNQAISSKDIQTSTESTISSSKTNKEYVTNFREGKDLQYNGLKHKISSSDNVRSLEFPYKIIDSTTARFFGFFSMVYMSGNIWTNIVSFHVLEYSVVNDTYIHNISCSCGANFCNVETECFHNNLKEPTEEVKYLLLSIFLAINVIATLLIVFFLDPLENKESLVKYSLDFALDTLKQLKKPLQLLLVPLSLYMGILTGYFQADFPKAFVGCAWGMHHIGLVTIAFGISCSLMSTPSALLVKHIGRRTIFTVAFLTNVAMNVVMLLWIPDSNYPMMFFVIAAMWGFVVACVWSQLKAFHGLLFKDNKEAAFGCYELNHFMGAALFFALSNYLCAYVKIYVMLFVSTLGMIGYLIAEKMSQRK